MRREILERNPYVLLLNKPVDQQPIATKTDTLKVNKKIASNGGNLNHVFQPN